MRYTGKKIRVGDIDIAYRIFGNGGPSFLLISGASSTMESWEPSILRDLSSNHTVIVFDNHGVGNTTSVSNHFQLSNLQTILLVCGML